MFRWFCKPKILIVMCVAILVTYGLFANFLFDTYRKGATLASNTTTSDSYFSFNCLLIKLFYKRTDNFSVVFDNKYVIYGGGGRC